MFILEGVFQRSLNGVKRRRSPVDYFGPSHLYIGSYDLWLWRAKFHFTTTLSLSDISYTIRVTTADQSDAGTEAQAWIVLIGTEAASEKLNLDLIQKSGFAPGLTETFSVEAVDVSEIKKIELGHNGYGPNSGWFVKEVEVDVPTSGKKFFFPCNRWLAQDKEDGKVVRVLSASDDMMVTYKPRE